MDARQERGLELAATKQLRQKGPLWIVPSQAGTGSYVVDPKAATCTCPDHETRGQKCKHIYAVEFSVQHEVRPDGTHSVTKTVRVTYGQDWPAYNAAQTNEKTRLTELLKGLCSGISTQPQGKGRPRLPLPDVVFSAVMKVYGTMSGRRSMSDLRDCQEQGHVAKAPHYNSIFHYLEDPSLTPILKSLVEESASRGTRGWFSSKPRRGDRNPAETVCGSSVAPTGADTPSLALPRLAPWATFYRPFRGCHSRDSHE